MIKDVDNTITKLLYINGLENGDLKKLNILFKVSNMLKESSSEKNDGLVFYQFGKYLTKRK